MGASSPRTLHSPRCWFASHLHTLLSGLRLVSTLPLFLATLSRKGKRKILEPLQLPEALEKEEAEERACSWVIALLPSEGSSQPRRCVCLSPSPCSGAMVLHETWPGPGEVHSAGNRPCSGSAHSEGTAPVCHSSCLHPNGTVCCRSSTLHVGLATAGSGDES